MVNPVFSFMHNWDQGFTETLEWLTVILTSQTGAEQRYRQRLSPRRMFEYTVQLAGSERSFFDLRMMKYGASVWSVPAVHDVEFVAALPQGSTAIAMTTVDREFVPGSALLVSNDPRVFEIVTILAVNSDGLVLAPTVNTWVNAYLFPLIDAKLVAQGQMNRQGNGTVIGSLKFLSQTINDWPNGNGGTADPIVTYQGYRVITTAPDYSSELSFNYNRLINEQDNKIALPLDLDAGQKGFPSLAHNWTTVGRSQVARMRDLLYAFEGRLTPMWFPTFMNDMTIVGTAVPGSAELIIDNIGYSDGMQDMFNRTTIMIEMVNGNIHFANIFGSQHNPNGTETIFIDTPISDAVSPATVLQVSFMTLSRLDTDSIDLKFSTDSAGVMKVGVTTKAVGDFRNGPDWTPPPLPNPQEATS